MIDYHVKITDGSNTNCFVCTSALSPEEFEDEVYNSLYKTDPESNTIVYVKYTMYDLSWR